MKIVKRSGEIVGYEQQKIRRAIEKAFQSINKEYDSSLITKVVFDVEKDLFSNGEEDLIPTVEQIQDIVERSLMKLGFFDAAKSYILYREKRATQRQHRLNISRNFPHIAMVDTMLCEIQSEFCNEKYPLELLEKKFISYKKNDMSEQELLKTLIKAAVELTSQENPKWELIAARLLFIEFQVKMSNQLGEIQISSFYNKMKFLANNGLYGQYLLEKYTKEEYEQCEKLICEERNKLFNYSGLELLLKRYVIQDHNGNPLETPQEMFLGIAMHLAMNETVNRLIWVKRFYDMLSTLKVTMATPTLSNARKPYHQLSSCFIDTVPDSLDGIFRSIDNFAKVSKFGGGMGLYFGKVRAQGSDIRGFAGAAGGVIRWIRLVNDTAVAVDQLGMRQGAVAVYLDAWHKDLPEFLALRTNNGDDRMKAHDVFPAICYPDLFWKLARHNIDADWYLMCPHEILKIKGYAIEDSFGDEWEAKYYDCVADNRIKKRVIPIKEIIRLIIKSVAETGTPFVFNRDTVNRANPNAHKGIIYCSNLCTEIAQNMSAIESKKQYLKTEDGDTIVVSETVAGDFVVCNLASLSLGRLDIENEVELEENVKSVVRALDNVIDLNFFPVPYAKVTNHNYRPIGLGVSGYHHMLATRKIKWESEEHLTLVDKLFEKINYYAIKASCQTAKEKGSYNYFIDSDWHTGKYFEKRNYVSEKWKDLASQVQTHGIRNAYLMAVAPTSSTSILTGTTAGIDPVMNRFYLEEKKSGLLPRVAPDLSTQTYWYYKNAHLINQQWSIRACGVRQRHIDQSQSLNLYITNEYTFRQVLELYLKAYEEGVKTVYYIRSKSLEVEECESCSS